MGFTAVVAYVMMFIIVIGMIFVLVSSHTLVIKEKSDAIGVLADIKQRKSNTDISVEDILFSPTNISFLISNNGIEKLHLERLDTYFGKKISHEASLLDEYNIINSQLWDSNEILNLSIEANLTKNENHTLIITIENGGKLEITFITHMKDLILDSASKTNRPLQDDKILIEISDNTRLTVTLPTASSEYLYANYSYFGHVYNSEVEVEHYFDTAVDVDTKNVEYFNGSDWLVIGELSGYESELSDTFNLDITPMQLRINYYSSNVGTINSYVDVLRINSNITEWIIN